ncbi:hypothetical protein D3C87_1689660 [compost metagenome]
MPVDRLDGTADTERIGQEDRRFDLAKLGDLRRTREFAETVEYGECCRHLVLKQIAGMRQDGGHTRARPLAFDAGHMANGNAHDIGDRVERTGLVMAYGNPEITQARTMFNGH